MKRISKVVTFLLVGIMLTMSLAACDTTVAPNTTVQREERNEAIDAADRLRELQPIPTDIQASLERHNLIRRSYWINGMRDRAMSLPNPVANPPLAQIVLLTEMGAVVGIFMVEGKVTSLNYSLVPYSDYWEAGHQTSGGQGGTRQNNNRWIANAGGVYGTNNNGIFFFTPEGKYVEWNGLYLFTDIPMQVTDPAITFRFDD